MSCNLSTIGKELGHWVELQSIAWFKHLFLMKYENMYSNLTLSNVEGDLFETDLCGYITYLNIFIGYR
jgi:hypothetical protein